MSKTITCIIRVKTALHEAAEECLSLFGEGARLDAQQVEDTFSLNNTPAANGYVRVVVAPHIATALQYLKDTGAESENVEIVRVEWHGQDRVERDGELVEELFQTGTEPILDEHGKPTVERAVYLGRIGV